MTSWQSAVIHPLGLAGYALACVFGLVARFGPTDQYPWLAPSAVAMACTALVTALLITLRQKSLNSQRSRSSPPSSPVLQKTRGVQSPAIAHTEGPVSINYSETGRRRTRGI